MNSIIQWNINEFFKISVDINRVLFEFNPLILCFQETNLKNSQLPNLKNLTGYIKNRTVTNRASGGVAIFNHKNIESKEVTIQTHLETIAKIVELDKQICICNIYIQDNTPFTSFDIKNIID
jgi:exonuclease III